VHLIEVEVFRWLHHAVAISLAQRPRAMPGIAAAFDLKGMVNLAA
jgi:hypothetical protein